MADPGFGLTKALRSSAKNNVAYITLLVYISMLLTHTYKYIKIKCYQRLKKQHNMYINILVVTLI